MVIVEYVRLLKPLYSLKILMYYIYEHINTYIDIMYVSNADSVSTNSFILYKKCLVQFTFAVFFLLHKSCIGDGMKNPLTF